MDQIFVGFDTWRTFQKDTKRILLICSTKRYALVLVAGRFHGVISRDEADLLLTADDDEDGRYLIRESQRAKEQYTLAIRYCIYTLTFFLSDCPLCCRFDALQT